jgi:hypothetical protein
MAGAIWGRLTRSSAWNLENWFFPDEVAYKSGERNFSPASARFSGPERVLAEVLGRGCEVFEGEESLQIIAHADQGPLE